MVIPTDQKLNELRRKGDPLADTCIQELFRTGEIGAVNSVLDALAHNGGPIPDSPPAALREYLVRSAELPADYDAARFERAQDAFVLYGPAMGVALMYSSLPSLYAGAMGGVQLLAMTGQLENHYRRRAAETLRFILDCMEPGGFGPSGAGIRAVQKVRLVHATVRFFARHSGRWAALPQWGEPLNQEELAGTLLAFSVVAVDNARQLGAAISDEQGEDLLYAWRVVGHLLGITPEAMPQNLADARSFWKKVGERNFGPTREGRSLAADHLGFLDQLVPGKAMDGINLALSRWLMGPDVAGRCLGIRQAPFWTRLLRPLLSVLGLSAFVVESFRPVARLTALINTELMESLDSWWSNNKSPQFRIPTGMGPRGTITQAP